MHVGLLGGLGPAATSLYYSSLMQSAKEGSFHLEMTIAHVDMPTMINNFVRDDKAAQSAIYEKLSLRLANAGADFVALVSLGGSFCLDNFLPKCPLPFVDILGPVNTHLKETNYKKIGLLGSNKAMTSGLYGKISSCELIIPDTQGIENVNSAYLELATKAHASSKNKRVLSETALKLIHEGAEAILLGGTDLFIAFDDISLPVPSIDCAKIHIAKLAKLAAMKSFPK